MIKSEQINELVAALAKAQGEYKPVEKDCVNSFFKKPDGTFSRYPSLASYIESAKEALAKNGLSISQDVEVDDNGKFIVITSLFHSSGQFKQSTFPLVIAKMDIHGIGSSITYSRRFTYSAILGMAPEEYTEDDGNIAAGKSPFDHKPQQPTIDERMKAFVAKPNPTNFAPTNTAVKPTVKP